MHVNEDGLVIDIHKRQIEARQIKLKENNISDITIKKEGQHKSDKGINGK